MVKPKDIPIETLNQHLADAVSNGSGENVRHLLASGADACCHDNFPLRHAINCGYIGIVRILLENGANPNYGNGDGLQRSILAWETAIMQLLLKHGADPKIQEHKGFKAVLLQDRTEHVQIFVTEYGCNPEVALTYPQSGEKSKRLCSAYILSKNLQEKPDELQNPIKAKI